MLSEIFFYILKSLEKTTNTKWGKAVIRNTTKGMFLLIYKFFA